jgi:hypothetical protein
MRAMLDEGTLSRLVRRAKLLSESRFVRAVLVLRDGRASRAIPFIAVDVLEPRKTRKNFFVCAVFFVVTEIQ